LQKKVSTTFRANFCSEAVYDKLFLLHFTLKETCVGLYLL
jgi:hypothetical protein